MSERTVRIGHPLAQGAEVAESDLWEFPEGLIGLPDYRSFALLDLPGAEPFRLLCSADDPSFGLVLVDPCAFEPDYVLSLSPEDLAPLPSDDPDAMEVLVPVVLPAEGERLSLNLKGPLVLWPAGKVGIQRVSRDEDHRIRHEPDPARFRASSSSCSS